MKHQRSWYLWLSRRDHLPRKLREVLRVSYDIITYEQWSNVTINGEILDEKFAWKPPEGWEEFRFPAIEEGLLKAGTEAPDFELASADGSQIRLSDFRGKVVWFYIWRAGVPACREEMRHLQEQYLSYREKGLVVLGINYSDQKKVALEFLKENSATFPNILDTSQAAIKACHRDYQTLGGMSAVPLSYIIDREGKIVDAWYGYEEGHKRAIATLEKAGMNMDKP